MFCLKLPVNVLHHQHHDCHQCPHYATLCTWKLHRCHGVKRQKSLLCVSPTCVFFFVLSKMSALPLQRQDRATVSGSTRRSQQPYLLLDGAVRMHRLISPHNERGGTAFLLGEDRERRDVRGVSNHKDGRMDAREVASKVQNVTVPVSGPGCSASHPERRRCFRCFQTRGRDSTLACGVSTVNGTSVRTRAGSHGRKKQMTVNLKLFPIPASSTFH